MVYLIKERFNSKPVPLIINFLSRVDKKQTRESSSSENVLKFIIYVLWYTNIDAHPSSLIKASHTKQGKSCFEQVSRKSIWTEVRRGMLTCRKDISLSKSTKENFLDSPCRHLISSGTQISWQIFCNIYNLEKLWRAEIFCCVV